VGEAHVGGRSKGKVPVKVSQCLRPSDVIYGGRSPARRPISCQNSRNLPAPSGPGDPQNRARVAMVGGSLRPRSQFNALRKRMRHRLLVTRPLVYATGRKGGRHRQRHIAIIGRGLASRQAIEVE